MRRYVFAYAAWLATVLAAAMVAAAWYHHVERIGWDEMLKRIGEDSGG